MRSEWEIKKLCEIVEFNPRESLSKGIIAKKISMDKLQPFCRDIPSYEFEAFSGGTKFRNGDTIMARITPCLENGKTAKVSILDDNEIGFGSTEYIVFRAKEGMDEDFLYYLVCSSIIREPAIKSMVGSSGRQRVQIDVLQNLEIQVPSVKEQRIIGKILRNLDDKIQLNNKINKNLEQQAQTLYDKMMVSKVYPLKTLGSITQRNSLKVGNNNSITVLSALNTGNLKPSEEYFSKQVFSKDTSKYILVNEGDFAYNPARINIGSIGINDLGYIGCVSPVYIAFSVDPDYKAFFRFYLKTKGFREECKLRASGSVRQALNYIDFARIETQYPDREEAVIFNQQWNDYHDAICSIVAETEKLIELRDSLLPQLMSGKFNISDINI